MSSVIQTIEIDAQKALAVIDTLLPFAEKYIPAVASIGGPVGMGVSLAAGLLPLIELIPTNSVYTVAMQQSYRDRVRAFVLLDFSGPQWQLQGAAPAKPPVP